MPVKPPLKPQDYPYIGDSLRLIGLKSPAIEQILVCCAIDPRFPSAMISPINTASAVAYK